MLLPPSEILMKEVKTDCREVAPTITLGLRQRNPLSSAGLSPIINTSLASRGTSAVIPGIFGHLTDDRTNCVFILVDPEVSRGRGGWEEGGSG